MNKYRIAQDIETQNFLVIDCNNKMVDYFNYYTAASQLVNFLNKMEGK